jgi:hypothetical protein
MGLDISAYQGITLAEDVRANEDGEPVDERGKYRYDVCIPRAVCEKSGDLVEGGFYLFTNCFEFRAGSYGGYGEWREELAKLAGYPLTDTDNPRVKKHAAACWNGATGPFSEMINFSDCEGVLGAEVCAKLLGDFENFYDQALKHDDVNFFERYDQWTKAFEMAADGGCVQFH